MARASTTPIVFRCPDDLVARVDAASGGNRSKWIRGLIERELGSPAARSELEQESVDRAVRFRRMEALRRARKSPAG
jgi:hypothetical protein